MLVGSYELLMMIIRGAQIPADVTAGAGLSGRRPVSDPLQVEAAQVFAVDLVAGRVPSVRAIRAASYRTAACAVGTGVHGQPRPLDGRDAARTSISNWMSGKTGSSITACVAPAENAGERSARAAVRSVAVPVGAFRAGSSARWPGACGQGRLVASMYQLSSQVPPPSVEKACSQWAEPAVMSVHRNRASIGMSL